MPVSSPTTSQVAVAIPVYNGADYLSQAMRSAVDQSAKPAEISIVDDASTDQTPAVIQDFSNDPMIRCHRLPQRVPAPAAWNAAVRSTSASHLVVLAHDDILDPAFCQEAQRVIDSVADADLIAFGHLDITADGQSRQVHSMRESGLPIGAVLNRDQFLDRFCSSGQFFLPSAVVMSRRIFDLVGGFDERLKVAYDWDFYLRAAAEGAKILLHEQVLCRYRLHAAQSVQAFTRKDNGDNSIIFEKLTALRRTLSARHLRMLADGMCDFMRQMVSRAVRDPAVPVDQVLDLRESVSRTMKNWQQSALPQASLIRVSPAKLKQRIAWELMGSRAGVLLIRRLLRGKSA
jgi:glycosyltransferase involved in cell wall biosynthesis